jgi:hypothetical protein
MPSPDVTPLTVFPLTSDDWMFDRMTPCPPFWSEILLPLTMRLVDTPDVFEAMTPHFPPTQVLFATMMPSRSGVTADVKI